MACARLNNISFKNLFFRRHNSFTILWQTEGMKYLFFFLLLASCSTIPPKTGSIHSGMTGEEVIAVLGQPKTHSEFRERVIWWYRSKGPEDFVVSFDRKGLAEFHGDQYRVRENIENLDGIDPPKPSAEAIAMRNQAQQIILQSAIQSAFNPVIPNIAPAPQIQFGSKPMHQTNCTSRNVLGTIQTTCSGN
jgi:hypothetical protein